MTKVAINGFGRIGRLVARAILARPEAGLELVAINDLADAKANAMLFKRDSVHGPYPGDVAVDGDALVIDGRRIAVTAERDPAKLPHAAHGVDIALECTGFFTDRASAQKHLDAGAKRVLISAPGKDVDLTVVFGVNDALLTAAHTIVSNASCTTNCLAPIVRVLHDAVGIERGLMMTIHSYTNDQSLLDVYHKDPRRARAAAVSMIPTSTGAAKTVGEVIPELKGKLDGISVRVPTPNVSLVDFTFTPSRATTIDEINGALKAASAKAERWRQKCSTIRTSRWSVTITITTPASSTVDSLETTVLDGLLVRVVSWYDNEWGFSNRMVDTACQPSGHRSDLMAADGRLAGIARHGRPRGPVEVRSGSADGHADRAGSPATYRGAIKPGGKGKRQVTVTLTRTRRLGCSQWPTSAFRSTGSSQARRT